MTQQTRIFSADELLAMPDDGNRYELVLGALRMMAPAGGRHRRIALKLARRLGDHVEQQQLGETFAAETGFLLQRNPDTVLAPDAAFVSHGRLGDLGDHPGYLPLAPDLLAEVVSPGDRWSEREEKALQWLVAGVSVVLVVDPQAKTVGRNGSYQPKQVSSGEALDLSDVISGFRLDVADLFS
jgi:Uma2 family endonuclease